MNARGTFQVLVRAGLTVGAVLAMVIFLAAMPSRRVPAPPLQDQQQPPPPPATSAKAPRDDMSGMHHMHGGDSSDEKQNEGSAVQDMMHGHHHGNGPHMYMTALRPRNAADEERARQVAAELRAGIEKYKDYRVALADGYRIFLPNVPQPEYHFTNYRNGFLEAFTFEPSRPTSLLYRKTADGYELVGAMYTMPKNAAEDQLNERVPLSVASWHLHTNLCMPTTLRGGADWTRFGLRGSISTQEACDAAGGRFRPVIFGWMVHVYPFDDSLDKMFAH
ncbi:MAG TPA: hypothetical protein VEH49_08840 [Methylomirabilota bacterium]|nr:hypothetical protein [Methylomirabilota bacterium]